MTDVPAVEMLHRMEADPDSHVALRTAVDEFGVSADDAPELLRAMLQWLAGQGLKDDGAIYVMLESHVARMLHAFILNTAPYRRFCYLHHGAFVDHHPVSPTDLQPSATYTIELLRREFGAELSPFLRIWHDQILEGNYRVSCVNLD